MDDFDPVLFYLKAIPKDANYYADQADGDAIIALAAEVEKRTFARAAGICRGLVGMYRDPEGAVQACAQAIEKEANNGL